MQGRDLLASVEAMVKVRRLSPPSTGIPHMIPTLGNQYSRSLPGLLQDRRAMRADTVRSAAWTAVEGADLAISRH